MDRWSLAALAVAVAVLAGCAPLGGRTLDPVGAMAGQEQGPPSERGQWVGRYEDSRGAGELTVQVRRSASRLDGVWRLRTGGDGVLTGTTAGSPSLVRFELASQGAPCFVLLEGAGEMNGGEWVATYSGRDCQGPVTDGRFRLRKR